MVFSQVGLPTAYTIIPLVGISPSKPSINEILPPEVINIIFGCLSVCELSSVSIVCKNWNQQANDDGTWKNLVLSRFEKVSPSPNNWQTIYKEKQAQAFVAFSDLISRQSSLPSQWWKQYHYLTLQQKKMLTVEQNQLLLGSIYSSQYAKTPTLRKVNSDFNSSDVDIKIAEQNLARQKKIKAPDEKLSYDSYCLGQLNIPHEDLDSQERVKFVGLIKECIASYQARNPKVKATSKPRKNEYNSPSWSLLKAPPLVS